MRCLLTSLKDRKFDGDGWEKPGSPELIAILAGERPAVCGTMQRALLDSRLDLAWKPIDRDGNCFFAAARFCVLSTPAFSNDTNILWLAKRDGAITLREKTCNWMLEHLDLHIPQFGCRLIDVWVRDDNIERDFGTPSHKLSFACLMSAIEARSEAFKHYYKERKESSSMWMGDYEAVAVAELVHYPVWVVILLLIAELYSTSLHN